MINVLVLFKKTVSYNAFLWFIVSIPWESQMSVFHHVIICFALILNMYRYVYHNSKAATFYEHVLKYNWDINCFFCSRSGHNSKYCREDQCVGHIYIDVAVIFMKSFLFRSPLLLIEAIIFGQFCVFVSHVQQQPFPLLKLDIRSHNWNI